MRLGYLQVLRSVGPIAAVRNMIAKRRCKRGQLGELRSKKLQFPLLFRQGSSDLNVFAQIFLALEYLCFSEIADVGLIIDLGANVGYSAAYFLSTFKDCFVVCVEPDPENFAILSKNLDPYADRCLLVQAAVWPESTRLWLNPATMSEENEWGRQVTAQHTNGAPVESVDVASLIAMTSYPSVSILKVDIEGAEREVFARNYESWLDRTENFCIEVHGNDCQAVLDMALAGRNFTMSQSGELIVGKRPRT